MLPLNIKDTKGLTKDFINKYLKNLKTARNKIIGSGIKVKVRKKTMKIYIPKNEKKDWKKRLSDKNLKRLMRMYPDRQKKVINIIKKSKLSHIHKENSKEYQALKYIFTTCGYNKLEKDEKKIFYSNLKINTCTYCNRNYIFDVEKSGHFKGHIDHFYPKGIYPYLGMSFFNFIPVCETCNYIKSDFDTANEKKTSIHPYERKDEKVVGTTLTSSVSNLSYKFEKDALLEKLYTEDMYNKGHKDILQELYIKFFQENTKEHFDLLEKSLISVGFEQDEIHRFITGGYLEYEEQHKRSFSKAVKDIKDEFESLKMGIK